MKKKLSTIRDGFEFINNIIHTDCVRVYKNKRAKRSPLPT